jgi:hypothetical protein
MALSSGLSVSVATERLILAAGALRPDQARVVRDSVQYFSEEGK